MELIQIIEADMATVQDLIPRMVYDCRKKMSFYKVTMIISWSKHNGNCTVCLY